MSRARSVWNASCDSSLLDVLFKERSEGRQTGNGCFHTSAWTTAATRLQGSEETSGGSAKTSNSCQTRYAMLKKEYQQVKQLRDLSGFGWDDQKGVVTAEDDVWERYLEAHPEFKKWRKNAFPLYSEMADLVEGTSATGKGVFRPGNDATPSASDDEDSLIDPALLSEEVAVTSTPLPSTLPAAPSVDTSASGSAKRTRNGHRKSGSMMIEGMASSISRLADLVSSENPVLSPERKRSAIHAIEDDGDLSDEGLLQTLKIIRRDTSFADTILAIRKKDVRTRFIKSELYSTD